MSKAQDAFLARRFGIFNHYLYDNPAGLAEDYSRRSPDFWNEAVDSVNVPDLARRIHQTGAGYYCITIMQGMRYLLSPNATYDRIAGTRPGEACSRRDLILEIGRELKKYDVDLFLYYTGDGPHKDAVIGPRFGFYDGDAANGKAQVSKAFVQNWASVLREYAVRYGDLVKGWWIDGCYDWLGYTSELLAIYHEACKAGNPDCLVAMNGGVKPGFAKQYENEEFVCGEFNDFAALPESRFCDGAQAHILAPLGKNRAEADGSRWCSRGARLDGPYMADYVRRANRAGMPVTIDVFVDYDGSWDADQYEVLCYIGQHLNDA